MMLSQRYKIAKWKLLRMLGYQEAKLRLEVWASGYFSEEWYLSQYPELLDNPDAVDDPLGHFLSTGSAELRHPGPGFHTAWYINEYEDVQASGMLPLIHYLRYGREEERWPTPYLANSGSRGTLLGSNGQHRVIYRTRRSRDFSHLGRVKRLNSQYGVEVWKAFSQAFHRSGSSLAQRDAEYLHNRGFMPDRKKLYRLPNPGVDAYLSDLQIELLPLANGCAHQVLATPALQDQLYRQRLPMVPPDEAVASSWQLKVLMITCPGTKQLEPLAAVMFRTANASLAGMTSSLKLSLNSGRIKNMACYHPEGKWLRLRRPAPWQRYRFRSLWRDCKYNFLPILAQSTQAAFIQADFDIGNGQLRLIRLHGKPQIEPFQVHGPIMGGEKAIDFLREYGL